MTTNFSLLCIKKGAYRSCKEAFISSRKTEMGSFIEFSAQQAARMATSGRGLTMKDLWKDPEPDFDCSKDAFQNAKLDTY